MSEQETRLQLSNAFLDRCTEIVEFHQQVEHNGLPTAWAELKRPEEAATWKSQLTHLVNEVRLIRLSLKENRRHFAERIGVDPLDLFVVENAAASPALLQKVVKQIDQAQHSKLEKKLARLLALSGPRTNTPQSGHSDPAKTDKE